jgi:hypothetical protein
VSSGWPAPAQNLVAPQVPALPWVPATPPTARTTPNETGPQTNLHETGPYETGRYETNPNETGLQTNLHETGRHETGPHETGPIPKEPGWKPYETGRTPNARPGITHSVSSPTTLPPGLPLGGNRPELPRRRRQSHLDDRLRTPAAGMPQRAEEADPELARNRMAAFQRGTRRGRAENADGENPNPRG